jgi:hypothetical protein
MRVLRVTTVLTSRALPVSTKLNWRRDFFPTHVTHQNKHDSSVSHLAEDVAIDRNNIVLRAKDPYLAIQEHWRVLSEAKHIPSIHPLLDGLKREDR